MSDEITTFAQNGYRFRVVRNVHGPLPHLDYREDREGYPWRGVADTITRTVAQWAAAMEARANEYHDTTMRQAKRIAEFEAVIVEADKAVANVTEHCYQSPKLHCAACARSLTLARQLLAMTCPCGGGPDHSPGWCGDYTEHNPAADALDKIWQAVILDHKPDYGGWEYPGQAFRHVQAEFNDLRARNAQLQAENASLREQASDAQWGLIP